MAARKGRSLSTIHQTPKHYQDPWLIDKPGICEVVMRHMIHHNTGLPYRCANRVQKDSTTCWRHKSIEEAD